MKKWGLILFSFLILGTGLAACSKPVVEETFPTHPTAVMESYLRNFGFKGMFASEGTEVVNTREEMQRMDHEFKFTGAIMKHLAGPASSASIARVDRNLLWQLDKKGKTYTECPLGGCPPPPGRPEPSRPEGPPQEKADRSKRSEPACAATLTKNDFSVKATGQKRVVNGFDAEEYQVTWLVVMEDPKKMKDTHTLNLNIWTTPENNEIREILKVQEAFHRAYLQKIGMTGSPLGKVVPKEALDILSAYFLGPMGEKERQSLLRAAKELEKIKGYPVSTQLEWYADAKACGQGEQPKAEKKEDKGPDLSGGVGGIVSGLIGKSVEKKMDEKAKENEGKPIFGYVQEIKVMKIQPASDGLFQPPADYKLANRK